MIYNHKKIIEKVRLEGIITFEEVLRLTNLRYYDAYNLLKNMCEFKDLVRISKYEYALY